MLTSVLAQEAVDEHVRNLQSLSKENALLKDKLRDMAMENHEVLHPCPHTLLHACTLAHMFCMMDTVPLE